MIALFLHTVAPAMPRSTWELVAIDAGAVTAVITAMTLLSKVPPIRWVIGRLFSVFSEPVIEMVERPTREAMDEIRPVLQNLTSSLEEHRRYTFYHLGPNGTAPPIVDRIANLEDRVSVNHSE